MTDNIKHGTLTGYKSCKCDECRAAASEYYRKRRESEKTDNTRNLKVVRPRKTQTAKPIEASKSDETQDVSGLRDVSHERKRGSVGETEQAVLDETANLSASESRPGMVSSAVKMARILDNPDLVKLHPTTSRQLTGTLETLRAASHKKTRGRLASVQQMTGRAGRQDKEAK